MLSDDGIGLFGVRLQAAGFRPACSFPHGTGNCLGESACGSRRARGLNAVRTFNFQSPSMALLV